MVCGFSLCTELNILTYNIHALSPLVARDNPKSRVKRIIENTKEYDIILLQENWIFSNQKLSTSLFEYTVFSSESSKFIWPVSVLINPNGSGLSTAIKKSLEVAEVSENHYGDCNGWIGAANDCFASKGFMYMVLNINGQRVDLYNTHLDAGNKNKDRSVRRKQLAELTEFVTLNSNEVPLIIAGDFNVNYFEEDGFEVMLKFANNLNLSIYNWAQGNSESQEILDYIIFRGSDRLSLNLIEYDIDHKLADLSDHPAIRAKFSIIEKNQ